MELGGRAQCRGLSRAPWGANEGPCGTADGTRSQVPTPYPAAHHAHSPHCSSLPGPPRDRVRSLLAPWPAASSWGSGSCTPRCLLRAPGPLSQPRSPQRPHSPVGQGPAPFSHVGEVGGWLGSGTWLWPGPSPPCLLPHLTLLALSGGSALGGCPLCPQLLAGQPEQEAEGARPPVGSASHIHGWHTSLTALSPQHPPPRCPPGQGSEAPGGRRPCKVGGDGVPWEALPH